MRCKIRVDVCGWSDCACLWAGLSYLRAVCAAARPLLLVGRHVEDSADAPLVRGPPGARPALARRGATLRACTVLFLKLLSCSRSNKVGTNRAQKGLVASVAISVIAGGYLDS